MTTTQNLQPDQTRRDLAQRDAQAFSWSNYGDNGDTSDNNDWTNHSNNSNSNRQSASYTAIPEESQESKLRRIAIKNSVDKARAIQVRQLIEGVLTKGKGDSTIAIFNNFESLPDWITTKEQLELKLDDKIDDPLSNNDTRTNQWIDTCQSYMPTDNTICVLSNKTPIDVIDHVEGIRTQKEYDDIQQDVLMAKVAVHTREMFLQIVAFNFTVEAAITFIQALKICVGELKKDFEAKKTDNPALWSQWTLKTKVLNDIEEDQDGYGLPDGVLSDLAEFFERLLPDTGLEALKVIAKLMTSTATNDQIAAKLIPFCRSSQCTIEARRLMNAIMYRTEITHIDHNNNTWALHGSNSPKGKPSSNAQLGSIGAPQTKRRRLNADTRAMPCNDFLDQMAKGQLGQITARFSVSNEMIRAIDGLKECVFDQVHSDRAWTKQMKNVITTAIDKALQQPPFMQNLKQLRSILGQEIFLAPKSTFSPTHCAILKLLIDTAGQPTRGQQSWICNQLMQVYQRRMTAMMPQQRRLMEMALPSFQGKLGMHFHCEARYAATRMVMYSMLRAKADICRKNEAAQLAMKALSAQVADDPINVTGNRLNDIIIS